MTPSRTRIAIVLAWILAGLLCLVISLTLLLSGVLYWAYKNPLQAFQKIEKHVLPADLKITWDSVRFKGEHLGGLDFLVDLEMTGLLVRKGAPSIDAPIDYARLRASVFPFKRRATLHLVKADSKSQITFLPGPAPEPSPEKNPLEIFQSVVGLLETIHDRLPIETFHVNIEQFRYGTSFQIQASANQELNQPLRFETSMETLGATKLKIGLGGHLDFSKLQTDTPFLNSKLTLKGADIEATQSILATSNLDRAQLQSEGPISYRKEKLNLGIAPKLTAVFTKNLAQINLGAGIQGIPGPLKKIEGLNLDLKTPLEAGTSWSSRESVFALTVPVDVFFLEKNLRIRMEKECACRLPVAVVAKADGKVWLSTLFKDLKETTRLIETSMAIESIQNQIFSLNLAGDIKVEKLATSAGGKLIYSPHLNTTAEIHSFKKLKPLLDAYRILIPAPFDVLDGTISFKANGPVATTERGSNFPLALNVDLKSSSQLVKLTTNAVVELNPTFTAAHLDLKAKVTNLNLDLPPLDPLGGMPRVTPDARFIKRPENLKPKTPSFKFTFNFEVETETNGAIRLASEYFQPALPITLKIQASGGAENAGFVQIEPFSVTYLRRTVKAEGLRIDLDSQDKGVFPMKGRLSVKQTDYTVFIDIEGTTKNPSVTMSSEPYLPKDDIIAVLLYDRTNDQLVSGDAEAAGGVQAAIADRAIGLFGLWAFAATPIKSFSYNPVTKVYTATVAVSDDLTAGIGTNWEESAHLELRKRVSKRWSLTAGWTPATQEEEATSKLVLQWEKRF